MLCYYYELLRQKWAFYLPEKIPTFKPAKFQISSQISWATIENTREF